jgi:hypothetical protein
MTAALSISIIFEQTHVGMQVPPTYQKANTIARQCVRVKRFDGAVLVGLLLWLLPAVTCSAQSLTDTASAIDLNPPPAPESLHFTAHTVERQTDGSMAEFDTLTGYRKYYAKNGQLQMEGKITRTPQKNYRDGVWKYYNEPGLVMKQETYNQAGKLRQLDVMYFKDGRPMSKTLQFFQGDYRDTATFKFIKIEVIFYTSGQKLSERHSVNGKFVYATCWDAKGHQQPMEYLKTVKSFSVDN